ncbi:hypothetical protein K402DRAFT_30173 [Aulographum hederae CBS 113979]|uniref:Uncharacterized protein n=1 Tax=Aulographum hederae CBS 113979 TaxID=1176131 RepID=A0A6G1H587_9PEZI|nr:hypothetical protein K402DRAFT_30173 [Aulographum hederae CBS 113979]
MLRALSHNVTRFSSSPSLPDQGGRCGEKYDRSKPAIRSVQGDRGEVGIGELLVSSGDHDRSQCSSQSMQFRMNAGVDGQRRCSQMSGSGNPLARHTFLGLCLAYDMPMSGFRPCIKFFSGGWSRGTGHVDFRAWINAALVLKSLSPSSCAANLFPAYIPLSFPVIKITTTFPVPRSTIEVSAEPSCDSLRAFFRRRLGSNRTR